MQCHFKHSSPRWTPICHWVGLPALRCLCKQKPYLPEVWVSSCTGAGPIFKTYRMCNLMSIKPQEGICHLTLEWTTVLKWEFLQDYLHKDRLNTFLAFGFPRLPFKLGVAGVLTLNFLPAYCFRTHLQCMYQAFISDMQYVHHMY